MTPAAAAAAAPGPTIAPTAATPAPPEPGCDGEVWYADVDGDAWGDATTAVEGCQPDLSWVAEAGDCDDLDPDLSPSDLEYCDGLGNDCDEGADEVSALDALSWFVDYDGDGYAGEHTRTACSQPSNGWRRCGQRL